MMGKVYRLRGFFVTMTDPKDILYMLDNCKYYDVVDSGIESAVFRVKFYFSYGDLEYYYRLDITDNKLVQVGETHEEAYDEIVEMLESEEFREQLILDSI